MEKLLTIVIPVYNTEKYLSKCLNSLIVRKYMEHLEILVVIDGSPDNSAKIAREYEIKFPNTFIVVEKENGGHGSAINKGLELATGKYFRILDSDDWFDKSNFEAFLDRLSIAKEDLVMTHIIREYTSENRSVLWKDNGFKGAYENVCTDFHILEKVNFDFFAMARCTYKTSQLKQYNLSLLEHRSFEEAILHVFPLLFITSFIYYDMAIYHYFLERPNQSIKQKVTKKQSDDWRALVEQMIDFYQNSKNELNEEKKSFVLRSLKRYANNQYIIINKLPYKEAKIELKSYNFHLASLYKLTLRGGGKIHLL